ncbi:hypothetical protein CSA56_05210 [candidate division KSB3 bacterium]|uniref:Uncharacterized protein n=1 Tax=candidate division KSB3 bacterium TaxID=2044937 RepID=A0A2G6KHN5_9BACT|nr:MAG: hypothetical protein CSA56_05210 [candidate division KSB3 bacterium]
MSCMKKPYRIGCVAAIVCLSVAVYWNSLGNEFVNWDDTALIVENESIRALDWQHIKAFFTPGTSGSYQPIRDLSYAIDYRLWQLDPTGYHLNNIALHVCNTLLIYFITTALIKRFLVSCLVSLLFAVHPVHVEAVTWLSGRRDVLSLAFALCSVYGFLRFAPQEKARKASENRVRIGWLLLSVCAFSLGILTKAVIIVLPALLMLYDLCFLNPVKRWRRLWWFLPFWAIAAAFFRVYVSVARASGVAKTAYHGGSVQGTALTMLRVFGEYVKMLLLPKGLSISYGAQPVGSGWEPTFLLALAVFAAMLGCMAWAWKHKKPVFFGIAWFYISLLPVSNIIPISTVKADRYLYMPSVGFFWALAWLITSLWTALKRINTSAFGKKILLAGYWILIGSVLCSYAVLTIQRNRDWKNSHTLWAATLDTDPTHPIALNNLGILYSKQGMYEKAVALFEPILDSPVYFENRHGVMTNLAHAYAGLGMFDEAMEQYLDALRTVPGYIEAEIGLGNVYIQLHRYDEAEAIFRTLLRKKPDDAALHYQIGTLLFAQKKYDDAGVFYRQTIALDRSHIAAYNRLGICYLQAEKREKAEEVYQEALRIEPNSKVLREELGALLHLQNDDTK